MVSQNKGQPGASCAGIEGDGLEKSQRAGVFPRLAGNVAKNTVHLRPDDSHPTHIDGSAPPPGAVFVFGSNLAGRHGAGAAKYAAQHCHAEYGVGVGRTGNSYAIPTKGHLLEVLPLSDIYSHVKQFVAYAKQYPEQHFHLTRVGCGLAGYRDNQIAPLFVGTPMNVSLPSEWARHIEAKRSIEDKVISR